MNEILCRYFENADFLRLDVTFVYETNMKNKSYKIKRTASISKTKNVRILVWFSFKYIQAVFTWDWVIH